MNLFSIDSKRFAGIKLVLLIFLLFSYGNAQAAPQIYDVTPSQAWITLKQDFTATGIDLNQANSYKVLWDKQAGRTKPVCSYSKFVGVANNGSKLWFRCYPDTLGWVSGHIQYWNKTTQKWTEIKKFWVKFGLPVVSSVTPENVTYGQETTFTVRGQRLDTAKGISLFVDDCWGMKSLGGSSTVQRFRCWPRNWEGNKWTKVDLPGWGRLYKGWTKVWGPTVYSVKSYLPMVIGRKALISVEGKNLSPRLGLYIAGCNKMTHLGGANRSGNSKKRWFTCMPSSTGKKLWRVYRDRTQPKGQVKSGYIWVNEPVVHSVTPSVAYYGRKMYITITGKYLDYNVKLAYLNSWDPKTHFACSKPKWVSGNSTYQRFSCWTTKYNRFKYVRFWARDAAQDKYRTVGWVGKTLTEQKKVKLEWPRVDKLTVKNVPGQVYTVDQKTYGWTFLMKAGATPQFKVEGKGLSYNDIRLRIPYCGSMTALPALTAKHTGNNKPLYFKCTLSKKGGYSKAWVVDIAGSPSRILHTEYNPIYVPGHARVWISSPKHPWTKNKHGILHFNSGYWPLANASKPWDNMMELHVSGNHCFASVQESWATKKQLEYRCTINQGGKFIASAIDGIYGKVWSVPKSVTITVEEQSEPCNSNMVSGGDTADKRIIAMGKTAGTFDFSHTPYGVPDRFIVRYPPGGASLFDSGCVGSDISGSYSTRTVPLSYGGISDKIEVEVIPNCSGTSGTGWEYRASCP